MKVAAGLFFSLLVWAVTTTPGHAQHDLSYVEQAGHSVKVFEQRQLGYRIDLTGNGYTYVDFSNQLPEASFAALRLFPNAFVAVIAEDLGQGPTAEQYAEMVRYAMSQQMDGRDDATYKGEKDLGDVEVDGRHFYQKVVYADIEGVPFTYVISAIVNGDKAYQVLTYATNADESVLKPKADEILAGFTLTEPTTDGIVVNSARPIRDYRSEAFGYRFRAKDKKWFSWSDLADDNDSADIGVLSTDAYGAVITPVCWQGESPGDNAIFRVTMQQFGEDYPSEFITEERDISKDGANGKLLIGKENQEGTDYLYYTWIVANERCAYTLAGWGPARSKNVEQRLARLWNELQLTGTAGASTNDYRDIREQQVNAYNLNAFGIHYYESRSYRDAFRFFSAASDLQPGDGDYLTNSLRSLSEISAYAEAYDWLQPKMQFFADNQVVQSWDAWLAYQTGDAEKSLRVYGKLFAGDYRDDEDFSTYLAVLADKQRWDEVDAVYAKYTAAGVTDATKLAHAQMLQRRGNFDEALQILEEMQAGRPFSADLIYEQLDIVSEMQVPAEALRLANLLIDNGYRSLKSYYYKGDAEYQLRSYSQARESFEKALTYSPGNATVRDYIDAIDRMLGQSDVSTISTPIDAVELPGKLAKIFADNNRSADNPGYGAEYLNRMVGYDFNGGETLTRTLYRKVRILDDNGIAKYSTLEFDFDPAYEKFYVNSLVVRDADGKLLGEGDLSTYYITNTEAGYEASTEKTVHIPVPSLAIGTVLEAVISIETGVEAGSFPLDVSYLGTDRPISYSALFVQGEIGRLAYESNGVGKPRQVDGALLWELENPVAFRWEPMQPFFDEFMPWVQLGTVGASWEAVGNEYLARINDKLDGDNVAERAQRLVERVDDEMRRIEILSAWVQDEIHYEAIEFGRRAYIPKSARDTVRDRYGDCKDHAVLLYSMLRSVGVDASLALVNLRQNVHPTLPNTDQFNHMIVAVPRPDGTLFIDATDKDMRLGPFAPRFMGGNQALVLGQNSVLQQMPEYAAGQAGIEIERVVESGGADHINVTETARFSGYQAAELRGQLRSIETSEMRASLQRWIASRYSDAELTDHFVENVFDAGYDLIVEIQYTLPLEADGSFDIPGFLEAYYLEYDRDADRRFPFEFHFPLQVSTTTSIRIPAGRRLDAISRKPTTGESRFGNWRREVSEADTGWEIRFDYVASAQRFPAVDYRDFAEFQRRAVDAIEQAVVLQ